MTNTAPKRASAIGFNLVSNIIIIPSGTINQGDRQTISHMYSGIAAVLAQKWATQAPDSTIYSTQVQDATQYVKQAPNSSIWTMQQEDN